MRRSGRASHRSILLIIATLLFSSAVVRLGLGVGVAFAQVAEQSMVTGLASSEAPDGIEVLLAELRAREARLVEEEARISTQARSLELAGEEIERKLAELTEAEKQLAKTIAVADVAAEEDVARLVALYENMKPKDAARLFQEMAPEFAAGFLAQMRPDAAAQVLAGIEARSAYTISLLIAGRNANAPKN